MERIPRRIAPLSPFWRKKPVSSVPTRANIAQMPWVWNGAVLKSMQSTSVAPLATTIFEVWSAMKQMKSPMPADTAFFRATGIALNIPSRTGVSESARKMSPSTKTARSANCQL